MENETVADDPMVAVNRPAPDQYPEFGKWYTTPWPGPMVLVEYWNGNIQRLPLNQVNMNDCGAPHGIHRWCLLPTQTVASDPFSAKT